MNIYSDASFEAISKELEKYYFAFSKFWNLSNIEFSSSVNTLIFTLPKNSNRFVLKINPEFWAVASFQEKLFYIIHECLHITLGHHWRIANLEPLNEEVANAAADIVVNDYIREYLGFDHTDIDFCVYPVYREDLLPDEESGNTLEYYYRKLMKENPDCANQNPNSPGAGGDPKKSQMSSGVDSDEESEKEQQGEGADGNKDDEEDEQYGSGKPNPSNSGYPSDFDVDSPSDNMQDLDYDSLDKVMESFDAGEKEEIKEQNQKAGTEQGNALLNLINQKKPKKKKKWETVIKKWTQNALSEFAEEPSWTKEHQRVSALMKDCVLPFDSESDGKLKERIDLVFFMDTSGSCISLADRFFKAAASLDPKKFNIKLFCFDTRIYEVSLKKPVARGGGGTYFDILEEKLQTLEKYPKAVFMITDGEGDYINPEYPKRWHVFLTERGTTYCFPETVNFYQLKDFE